jgi:hypothetical protein
MFCTRRPAASLTLQVFKQGQQGAFATRPGSRSPRSQTREALSSRAIRCSTKPPPSGDADAGVRPLDALRNAEGRIDRSQERAPTTAPRMGWCRSIAFKVKCLQRARRSMSGAAAKRCRPRASKLGLAAGQAIQRSAQTQSRSSTASRSTSAKSLRYSVAKWRARSGLTQCAKGPGRWGRLVRRRHRRPGPQSEDLRQKAPACNAVAQRAVSALQKGNHRIDVLRVVAESDPEEKFTLALRPVF